MKGKVAKGNGGTGTCPGVLRNWVRHQQKLMNKDELKPERTEMYKELLALMEEYKRVKQYK